MNEIYGYFLKAIDKKAYEDYMVLNAEISQVGDIAMASIAYELIKKYLVEIYKENSNVSETDVSNLHLFELMDKVKKENLISDKEYSVIDSIRLIRNKIIHKEYLVNFSENKEIMNLINNIEIIDEAILFDDSMCYDEKENLELQLLFVIPKKDMTPREIFDRVIIDIYFRLFMRKKFSKKYFCKEIPTYG